MIALCLLFLMPLYWMVNSSLKSDEELNSYPPTWWPHSMQFSNYVDALTAMPFLRLFANTAIITLASVGLSVVSSFLVAYGFACIEWPGRNKLFYIVLATLFLPFPVTLIPMFDLYANLGWVDTWLPLIVPHMFGSAFYIFLLRQFLLQVPKDMLDAARMDGANDWQIAWRLVFPSALSAITAVAIFTAVATWNDFMGPLIYLQDTNKQTLSIGLQTFKQVESQTVQYNQMMAASFMVVLPLIILFIVFQRYFLKGITIGGFK
ncbi:carbohydrate ABC transporter permease [Microlunatus elymi]|uniref:Carbohydrate ABC transporter permease n=2 Tax=Microlunatus elymi TaxID=2596828 RepID=A0A516Q6F6_9ACTN|nr:carbohydrate ABC transporter permease [Microlunatus elymi]